MSIKPDQDLNSQQEHLSSTSYDLRITNLARFIYSRIKNEYYAIPDSDPPAGRVGRESMDPRMREDDMRLKFLDVGAGNGLFLKFFKEKGYKVAGFELEKKNVHNMKRDPELTHENITQADITKLTGKQEYDVVMASDVIEHIKNDILAIRNLWSFVKPGGMMLITVPAHSYLYGKRDEKWGHFRRYDAEVLLERINEVINTTPSPDKSGETPPYKGGEYKKNKALLLAKEEYPVPKCERMVQGEVVFVTFWNIVGFYTYFLFEKILHKPISENIRYSNTFLSRSIRFVLDRILRLEEMIGGLPLGLTLVVGVRRK